MAEGYLRIRFQYALSPGRKTYVYATPAMWCRGHQHRDILENRETQTKSGLMNRRRFSFVGEPDGTGLRLISTALVYESFGLSATEEGGDTRL